MFRYPDNYISPHHPIGRWWAWSPLLNPPESPQSNTEVFSFAFSPPMRPEVVSEESDDDSTLQVNT